jgi:hypothetical protein
MIAAKERVPTTGPMLNTSVVAARNPAVTSNESPGRKNPTSNPVSAKTIRISSISPPNRMISLIPSTVVNRWTKFPIDSNPDLLLRVHRRAGDCHAANACGVVEDIRRPPMHTRSRKPVAQIPLACSLLLCCVRIFASRWLTSPCCARFRFSKTCIRIALCRPLHGPSHPMFSSGAIERLKRQ